MNRAIIPLLLSFVFSPIYSQVLSEQASLDLKLDHSHLQFYVYSHKGNIVVFSEILSARQSYKDESINEQIQNDIITKWRKYLMDNSWLEFHSVLFKDGAGVGYTIVEEHFGYSLRKDWKTQKEYFEGFQDKEMARFTDKGNNVYRDKYFTYELPDHINEILKIEQGELSDAQTAIYQDQNTKARLDQMTDVEAASIVAADILFNTNLINDSERDMWLCFGISGITNFNSFFFDGEMNNFSNFIKPSASFTIVEKKGFVLDINVDFYTFKNVEFSFVSNETNTNTYTSENKISFPATCMSIGKAFSSADGGFHLVPNIGLTWHTAYDISFTDENGLIHDSTIKDAFFVRGGLSGINFFGDVGLKLSVVYNKTIGDVNSVYFTYVDYYTLSFGLIYNFHDRKSRQ